jgi:hypothetical protein
MREAGNATHACRSVALGHLDHPGSQMSQTQKVQIGSGMFVMGLLYQQGAADLRALMTKISMGKLISYACPPRHSWGLQACDRPPKLSTAKAARKFQVGVKSVHQPPGPKKPVHEIEIDAIDKDDYEAQDTVDDVADEPAYDAPVATASGSDHEEHTEPSEALLEGLERISLSSVRLQKLRRLPFLRRNLQDGFAHRCKLAGVPTKRISLPRTSISVIYHCPLATTVLGSLRKAPPTGARSSMKDWFCPLCSLHHNFANQMMLDKHLSWDHPSVKALWGEVSTVYVDDLSLIIQTASQRFNPDYASPYARTVGTSFPNDIGFAVH